jgi:hypothetical protein
MLQNSLDKSQFLNVDLDIRSKSDLQPLVDAFGDKIIILYVGRENRHYKARIELNGSHHKREAAKHERVPETIILGFCKLIRGLPPAARKLWNGARTRDFDVGIESGKLRKYYWFELTPNALQAAVEVNAKISVSVYGPMKRLKTAKKSRKAAPSK